MAPAGSQWRLLDRKCVSKGSCATAGSPTHGVLADAPASALTTRLDEVQFYFQSQGGTLVLDMISNRCGGVQHIAEVLSTHHEFVLLRVCRQDIGSPPEFFAYSWPHRWVWSATVVKLPSIAPEIGASPSFGLVCHWKNVGEYVVANLQVPDIGGSEGSLYRLWHNSATWSSESVTLPKPFKSMKKEWHTDLVIPSLYNKQSLLFFVDLRIGIVSYHNPLQKGRGDLDFIYLPRVEGVTGSRRKTIMSVGYCKGTLKFVNLNISDPNKVEVTIRSFDFSKSSWVKIAQFSLECGKLWDALKNQHSPALELPKESERYMPGYPVLSTSENDILYLVMTSVDRKHAWLLRVNTKSGILECAIEYPGFWKHLKPPYSNYF